MCYMSLSFFVMYKILSEERYKNNKEVRIDQKGTTMVTIKHD